MQDAEDQQAIAAVLNGDVNAYAVLVRRYQTAIFNLMFRMTGSREDASDLAQETFIKAYENLYKFKTGRKFFPWLYTIGLNHSRNFLNGRNRQMPTAPLEDLELECSIEGACGEEDRLCERLDCRQLDQALDELPTDYREAVVLRYHEELPMEDVAAALDLSASGAKMRVHRGLKKLREILEKRRNGKGKPAPAKV